LPPEGETATTARLLVLRLKYFCPNFFTRNFGRWKECDSVWKKSASYASLASDGFTRLSEIAPSESLARFDYRTALAKSA
jgi:hypothetical protein